MTFHINDDGTDSTIERSVYKANGYDYFETWRQAKKALLDRLRQRRDDYNDAAALLHHTTETEWEQENE